MLDTYKLYVALTYAGLHVEEGWVMEYISPTGERYQLRDGEVHRVVIDSTGSHLERVE